MLSKYLTKFIKVNSHMIFVNKINSDGRGTFKMALAFVFLQFSITNRTFCKNFFFFLQLSFYWLCPFPPSFSFPSIHLFMSTPHVGIAWFYVLFLNMLFSIFFPLLSAGQGPLFTDGTSPTAALKIFSSLGRMLMKASAVGCYFRDTCVRCDWIFRGWGLLIFTSRKRQQARETQRRQNERWTDRGGGGWKIISILMATAVV